MDEPPDRDLFEIARRFRLTSGEPISRIVNPDPVTYAEGHNETFWLVDQVRRTAYTIQATLMVVSEHAYWYVDDSIDISVDDLRKAAEVFEGHIHPIVTGSFGDIWNPGVDNDPRLTILHTPLNGSTVGYFSPKDEYPRQIQPRSNQREMIYMDGNWQKPGSQAYLGVLAHELQHAIHWNMDTGEDSWVDEGLSEVAVELSGYRAFHVNSFLGKPDTQLTYRPDGIGNSPPYYGASTLFFAYLMQHYGGYESLKELVQEPADGINGVEAHLSPFGKTFLDVFKDWVVANYLDADEGPFSYPDRSVRTRDVDLMVDYGEKEGVLSQFGAAYIDLRLKKRRRPRNFSGRLRGGAGEHRMPQRAILLVGKSGRLYRHHADQGVRPVWADEGDAGVLDLVPDRGGLGLRLCRGFHRRRQYLDAPGRNAYHVGKSRRRQLRERLHRKLRRMGAGDDRPVAIRRQQNAGEVRVHNRRGRLHRRLRD